MLCVFARGHRVLLHCYYLNNPARQSGTVIYPGGVAYFGGKMSGELARNIPFNMRRPPCFGGKMSGELARTETLW